MMVRGTLQRDLADLGGDAPAGLADLERDGFLLVPGALDDEAVAWWKGTLYDLHRRGRNEIDNSVGNVAFESLLKVAPERSRLLVGHPSVAPYLKAILGKQCQLRSLRAHMNPRAYLQEWHMDFGDYQYQERKSEAGRPLRALCMNTTFYLTDNTPERGRLTFLTGYVDRRLPDEILPHVRHYRRTPRIAATASRCGATGNRRRTSIRWPATRWCSSVTYRTREPSSGTTRRTMSEPIWCCTTSRTRCIRASASSAPRT